MTGEKVLLLLDGDPSRREALAALLKPAAAAGAGGSALDRLRALKSAPPSALPAGFELFVADGVEAGDGQVRAAAEKRADVAIVLADASIAGGFDALARWRERFPSLRALLVGGDSETARQRAASVFAAATPPAYALLSWPATRDELKAALATLAPDTPAPPTSDPAPAAPSNAAAPPAMAPVTNAATPPTPPLTNAATTTTASPASAAPDGGASPAAATAPAVAVAANAVKLPVDPAGRRFVLVTDDEEGLRETYRQYLAPKQAGSAALERLRKLKASGDGAASKKESLLPEGWELMFAESGERALEIGAAIRDGGGEIAVAFFDVKMPPGIDGIETMLRLLRIFPQMRCGIVSAYNDRSVDEINALFDEEHRNRWDFISKPFTEAEIRQKARMLSATWMHHDNERQARTDLAELNANLERLVTERTEQLARSEKRMKAELAAAANIQMMLFPSTWPEQGLQFAHHIQPAEETGGDLCGYLDLGDGAVAVYIVDVTGHGAASALGTALLYCELRMIEREARLKNERPKAGEILARLNTQLNELMKGSLYASCFVAIVDRVQNKMTYANAGHEWPLVSRGGATSILPLLPSPLLGAQAEPHYPTLESSFAAGDVLLLYTDGLTDARDENGKPFDRLRLYKALSAAPKDDAASVKGAIDAAFHKLIPADKQHDDDITWVVVRAR